MTLSSMEMEILDILYKDSRVPLAQIAEMLDASVSSIEEEIAFLVKEEILVGFPALINWDKTQREMVEAIIEVKVTPQREFGFDAIARRIVRFEEVKSLYLMSGAFDLMIEMQARTLKELAQFVSEKLASLDSVLSTSTHFVLKKYKVEGRLMETEETDHRLVISP